MNSLSSDAKHRPVLRWRDPEVVYANLRPALQHGDATSNPRVRVCGCSAPCPNGAALVRHLGKRHGLAFVARVQPGIRIRLKTAA